MYTHIYIFICLHICIYIHALTLNFFYIYVYMYTYTHSHTHIICMHIYIGEWRRVCNSRLLCLHVACFFDAWGHRPQVCCSMLQYVAVCCNALQCVAMCCTLLQFVVVSCDLLECVAIPDYFVYALLAFSTLESIGLRCVNVWCSML